MVGRRDRALNVSGEPPARERGQRRQRIGEAMRHALSAVLRTGECRDPALQDISITVTEVRVSPDLRNASVFVMPLAGAEASEVLAGLRRCSGFLRGRAARVVGLRFAPTLAFTLDPAFDQAAHISRLLASPAVARDLGPHPASPDAD
jgi:ribosome-binding factor A